MPSLSSEPLPVGDLAAIPGLTISCGCVPHMSFDYDRDDARRRLVIAYRGEFLAEEVREILERIGADGVWSYAMLYDLREMTGRPDLGDLKQIVDARDAIDRRTAIRRGPVGLLVTDMPMYARVCAYVALAKSVLPIEVFRSLDEAEQWLRRQGPALPDEGWNSAP